MFDGGDTQSTTIENLVPSKMRGRRILLPLPNTGSTHRKARSYTRGVILIAFIFFILLQLQVFNYTDVLEPAEDSTNYSTAAILSMVPTVLHKFLKPKSRNHTLVTNVPRNGTATDEHNGGVEYHTPNITDIYRRILLYNEMQTILNEDLFDPLQNDSVIIVIQVHARITYLRHLIVSLAQAKSISKALLIFSHDFYDEDINDLIQTIDFCKVIQIFYPFSIQTHPDTFPGVDPNDCPRDIKREQAVRMKCNNADYPDLYGHYREATFTQTKHHWWWKANRVFNQLDATKYHNGLVLFLEEDHYVAEDFLHLLKMMEQRTKEDCTHCNILSLGTYLKSFSYYTHNNKVEVTPWISSKHNMGFAFNRSTWTNIRNCGQIFCEYDDYNWDWSLQYVSHQCMKNKLHAMVAKGPRIFHIGECGVHHKKNNCESNQVISKVQQVLRLAKNNSQLFPKYLILTVVNVSKKTKLRKGNGGWGDKRDHRLCINMTRPSSSIHIENNRKREEALV